MDWGFVNVEPPPDVHAGPGPRKTTRLEWPSAVEAGTLHRLGAAVCSTFRAVLVHLPLLYFQWKLAVGSHPFAEDPGQTGPVHFGGLLAANGCA